MIPSDARAPLCLVGMSGVGKSFWAKRLVDAGWTRHDCDGEIAARLTELVTPDDGEEPVRALGRWMGMPWTPGYAEREARYLALEEQVTARALEASTDARHVIDCTGSVVYLSRALQERLAAQTRVVYLQTPPSRVDAMLARYLAEPKPVVWGGAYTRERGEDERAALSRSYRELLGGRDARYRALAHVTLDGAALEASDPGLVGFLAACGS
ncbi:MAG: hypothetical protein IT374_07875 [Polyangiaceae bacterium]|nr:hypothetical protein [Polyangiaceae bacterium]